VADTQTSGPFADYIDLAADRVGGFVIAANDEYFAPKEALLTSSTPVFLADDYTDRGKWMDGWETRRRREPGHDWCVIRLGIPGRIVGIEVDTAFFRGNFPAACALDVAELPRDVTPQQVVAYAGWREVLPQSELRGDTVNRFPLTHAGRVTHVRFNIYPDGGVARLRIYGVGVPDWILLNRLNADIDLAAAEHGGMVVLASDMFFGARQNLILPGTARNMGEGWETRRRRGPGHDWAIVRLAAPGRIRRVEVDTTHFKGNAPARCSVEAAYATDEAVLLAGEASWHIVLPDGALQPHNRHVLPIDVQDPGVATHARFNIFPDGGVARLRLYGRSADQ
jgi:allantoicase